MTCEQRDLILAQLPKGTKWLRWYTSFESNEVRAIVQEPDEPFEKRYAVRYDENDYPHITHKP